jgi:hypothetical protein
MGNATTTAKLDQAINAQIEIMNTATQDCSKPTDLRQEINISNCSENVLENIHFDAAIYVNTNCIQDVAFNSSAKHDIEANLRQQVSSLVGGPGNATANAAINQAIAVGTAITNSFSQQCGSPANINQSINLSCAESGRVNIKDVTFNTYYSARTECTQRAKAVSDAVTHLVATIDQKATAETAPLISGGLFMIIAVVVLLFLITSGSSIVTIILVIVALLIVLTIIYLILAAIYNLEPFYVEENFDVPLIEKDSKGEPYPPLR